MSTGMNADATAASFTSIMNISVSESATMMTILTRDVS